MNPLTAADIVDIAQYERERPEFRTRVIEMKKPRRIQVGHLMTFIFENCDTVRFQIQEMMRAERIVVDDRIQEEIDTYNTLVPGANQLIATLLIEVTDQARLREILDRFIGVDHGGTTFLEIGDERAEGEYEGGRSKENRISAVHYVTFDLTPGQVKALSSGNVPVALSVSHGDYAERTVLSDATRASLAADLTG